MTTEVAMIIVAVVPTIAGLWTGVLTSRGNKRLKKIEKDLSVCKEASYSSLEAHVKTGSNGNVKRAYLRLRKLLFNIPEEDDIKDD